MASDDDTTAPDSGSTPEAAPARRAIPLRWKIFAISAPLTIALDQLTKVWARHSLPSSPDGKATLNESVSVIDGLWDWRLSHNPGSAFGLFNDTAGARIFLSIIGVVAVVAIMWMLKKGRDDQRRLALALGLVAGGAVGNLFDRVVYGVVTDFVVWKYKTHEWPTFNVADVALVVGVLMLFLDMGKDDDKDKAKAKTGAGGGKDKKPRKRAAEKG